MSQSSRITVREGQPSTPTVVPPTPSPSNIAPKISLTRSRSPSGTSTSSHEHFFDADDDDAETVAAGAAAELDTSVPSAGIPAYVKHALKARAYRQQQALSALTPGSAPSEHEHGHAFGTPDLFQSDFSKIFDGAHYTPLSAFLTVED